MKNIKITAILALALIILALAVPNSINSADQTNPFIKDAEIYARDNRVSLDEAQRRLNLQKSAGLLDAELSSKEADTFAGLWIQHSPDFRIIVEFTQGGEEKVKPYLTPDLAKIVEVRSARTSLNDLSSEQEAALLSLKSAGIHADSSINVVTNCVEINIPDLVTVKSDLNSVKLKLPDTVKLLPVKSLARPTFDLCGGVALDGMVGGATAGFAVVDAEGTRGITTCAHTDSVLFYLRYGVPFWLPCQKSRKETYYDVQWHTSGSFSVINQIDTGTTERRDITGSVSRDNQAAGSFVAKYGKTTGYTAGYISRMSVTLDYIPDCKPTFIQVDHSDVYPVLADIGDSGGPWFSGNDAYGTTCAKDGGGNAYYMAINYLSGIGVSLLTAP
jgi:hypothetical protein